LKKICFPLEGLNPSGGIRMITSIANNLLHDGFEVIVYVPSYLSKLYYPFDGNVKVNIIQVGNVPLFSNLAYYLFLIFKSASRNFALSIATGYKTPLIIFISKLLNFSSTKILYIIQGAEIDSHIIKQNSINRFLKLPLVLIARIGYLLPNKIIVVSGWLKQKLHLRNAFVIPNGVSLKQFTAIGRTKSSKIRFGVIFSPDPIKGYSLVFEAFKRLDHSAKKEIELFVYSKQMEIDVIEGARILLSNRENSIDEFYRKIDVFIFPSYVEGFGLPPLEAMACGVVPIISKCGGVSEYANDSNSILFQPGSVKDLVASIEKIVFGRKHIEEFLNDGLRTAYNFNINKTLDQYNKAIKSILV
jgi:glycosyltransferase involved in cell wall biosynthesis